MNSPELFPDAALLTKIVSIEGRMRAICDLIPISTWGFSSDVHEKLKQRKHKIVNQQLTKKEKRLMTKSKKQQLARSAGVVCHRVSEVIDMLSETSGKDAKIKKVSLPPRPPKSERKEKMLKGKGKEENPSEMLEGSSNLDDNTIKKPRHSLITAYETRRAAATSMNDSDDSSDSDGEVEKKVFCAGKRPAAKMVEVEAKKPKFVVKPVQCEAKVQVSDTFVQRNNAIQKLQAKLMAMREARKGKTTRDPSEVAKFEQERKLKRRMSKMKMKQRRSEQKQTKADGTILKSSTKLEQERLKDETISYSKFDFLVKNEGMKKKRLSTSEKKQKFTGRDYKSLINKVEKRNEKLENLKQKEPEKAAELEEDIKWKRALNKAQGTKVKDNMELLQKGLKRKQKSKEKRKEKWSCREANVEREMAKRQEKRKENLQKRIDDKRKRKLKIMKKKGRVV